MFTFQPPFTLLQSRDSSTKSKHNKVTELVEILRVSVYWIDDLRERCGKPYLLNALGKAELHRNAGAIWSVAQSMQGTPACYGRSLLYRVRC